MLQRSIICFSASLFFFYQFILGNIFPSIADNLMQEFHWSAVKIAYLSSAYYFANVIFLFFSGYILDHYSARKTMLWAMFLCVLSNFIFAATHEYAWMFFCRFLAGVSSAFCFIGAIRIASFWWPKNKMAMITGLIVMFAMTGGIVSQYPLTRLVALLGWRSALVQLSFLGLMLGLMMFWGVKERVREEAEELEPGQFILKLKRVFMNFKIMRAASYASLMNMVLAIFGAMMGTQYILARLMIDKESASIINSMLFFGAIFGNPLIAWISDKLEQPILVMRISSILSLLLLIFCLYSQISPSALALCFFALGLLSSAQILSYAWVANHSSPQTLAMSVSAVSILTQAGYVVYQLLYSFLLSYFNTAAVVDVTGTAYQKAAIMMPIGIALAYFLITGLQDHKE